MAPFFVMPPTTPDIKAFYLKQITEAARLRLAAVCKANGIPEVPTSASQLTLIPVYEDGFKETLLTLANKLMPTEIIWPQVNQTYVQAYFKRYRKPGARRPSNQVVIGTSNYCWARLFAAKELMHCLMDDDDYPASNTVELVNELIESLSVAGVIFQDGCTPQTIVDEMAWAGAYKYLIPPDWMPLLLQLQTDLAQVSTTPSLHIAQLLRVPDVVVSHVLRHHAVLAQAAEAQ
ncbi:MAG: hypothetical protein EOP50_09800 [Sphingobacteriales bacterium]|nr:MAG: hypothetical protein EOP50_09800 [Sphingobacteriales bacterium]